MYLAYLIGIVIGPMSGKTQQPLAAAQRLFSISGTRRSLAANLFISRRHCLKPHRASARVFSRFTPLRWDCSIAAQLRPGAANSLYVLCYTSVAPPYHGVRLCLQQLRLVWRGCAERDDALSYRSLLASWSSGRNNAQRSGFIEFAGISQYDRLYWRSNFDGHHSIRRHDDPRRSPKPMGGEHDTGMMLPIAKNLDDAGFEGIELISGSHLKKTVRELKEDPWERVRLISKIITKTPLRLIAGRVNTFENDRHQRLHRSRQHPPGS